MHQFFRNKNRTSDPVWHVQLAVVVAALLQIVIPDKYSAGPHYIIPAVELVLAAILGFTTPKEPIFRSLARRVNVFLLIGATTLANAYSLISVANALLKGGRISDGRSLILTALIIYLTNIIIFALWYWEMDGGGPGARQQVKKHEQDFMFPQHQNEDFKHPDWMPTFVDYLYVSSTNAMAFSPTDTLPMSRRAKMLMLLQATVSIVVVALVAARAVNILS
jgi:uncharacterized membrane protein